jgi:hypothetical protein
MRQATIMRIFGTKTKVISWICVAAWKILTSIPTIIDAISMGAMRISVDFNNSLNN